MDIRSRQAFDAGPDVRPALSFCGPFWRPPPRQRRCALEIVDESAALRAITSAPLAASAPTIICVLCPAGAKRGARFERFFSSTE
ncbi:MAG: hypothetical protein IPL88_01855 [Rhizobiales bacterium]|nr:hypothetical protein [Hyphomicrobiales bacterium]